MAHQAGAYPGFCSMKWPVFLLPLDGMLVHCRVTPSIKFAGTHLYTWVERGSVRVKCLAQEHNTTSPARARTWSARSRVERANHEATAPPTFVYWLLIKIDFCDGTITRWQGKWNFGSNGKVSQFEVIYKESFNTCAACSALDSVSNTNSNTIFVLNLVM